MSNNEGILKRLSTKFSALFKQQTQKQQSQTQKQQSKFDEEFKIDVQSQRIDPIKVEIQEGPPKFERIVFPTQKYGKIIPRVWGQLEHHYSLQAKQREYQKMPILQKNYPLVDEHNTTSDKKSRWDPLQFMQNNQTNKCVQTDIEYFDMKQLTQNKQSAQRSAARDQIKPHLKQQKSYRITFPFQDSGSLAPLSKVITSPEQSEFIQTNPKPDDKFIAQIKQNVQQKEQFSESKQTSASKVDEMPIHKQQNTLFPIIDNQPAPSNSNSESLTAFFTPKVKQIPQLDDQKTPGFDQNSLQAEKQPHLQQQQNTTQIQQQQQIQLMEQENKQQQQEQQQQQQDQILQVQLQQQTVDSQTQPISNPFAQTLQFQLNPPWLSNNQQQNNTPIQYNLPQPMNNLFQGQLPQQPQNPFQNTLSMQFQEPQQQYQQIPSNQYNYQQTQIYPQQQLQYPQQEQAQIYSQQQQLQYPQQSQLVPEQNMLGGGSFSANQISPNIFPTNNFNTQQSQQSEISQQPQQQQQQLFFQSQNPYQQNIQQPSSQAFPWQNSQPQMSKNNGNQIQTQQSQNSSLFAPINPESLFQTVANKKGGKKKPFLYLDELERIE